MACARIGSNDTRIMVHSPSCKNQPIGLGDVVSFQCRDGYKDATVSQVHSDGTVDVFRPYTHTSDFSCSGRREGSQSLICYVGVEVIKDMKPDSLKLIRKAGPVR
jgi:hypothetical protein